MAGFYCRFIRGFSQIAEPLNALKRKNARFVLGEAQQTAFQQLKEALTTSPALQIPDFFKGIHLVHILYSWTLSIVSSLSKILEKTQRFGDWILSPPSGKTYSVGPNR
jgi:hypothetical protein